MWKCLCELLVLIDQSLHQQIVNVRRGRHSVPVCTQKRWKYTYSYVPTANCEILQYLWPVACPSHVDACQSTNDTSESVLLFGSFKSLTAYLHTSFYLHRNAYNQNQWHDTPKSNIESLFLTKEFNTLIGINSKPQNCDVKDWFRIVQTLSNQRKARGNQVNEKSFSIILLSS